MDSAAELPKRAAENYTNFLKNPENSPQFLNFPEKS
jgi:hypothetical protein